MASRRSPCWIRSNEENTGGIATTMKKEIDWEKELLESGRFNDQFSENLLENGSKNFMQGIYLGYMYSRWRKLRGMDKEIEKKN